VDRSGEATDEEVDKSYPESNRRMGKLSSPGKIRDSCFFSSPSFFNIF
jgi:hypothetical protein